MLNKTATVDIRTIVTVFCCIVYRGGAGGASADFGFVTEAGVNFSGKETK